MQTKEPAVRLFPLFDITLCYCPEASEWPAIRLISPPVIKTTCVHVDVVLLHCFPTLHQTLPRSIMLQRSTIPAYYIIIIPAVLEAVGSACSHFCSWFIRLLAV